MNPEKRTDSWQSIGAELASFLSDRREAITAEWMAAVEQDTKLPSSDNLTLHQLRDHLPQLSENLNATLRNAFSPDLKAEAAETAAKHGEHRWKEGYDLSELLREFSHVRSAFIGPMIEFEEHHPDFGLAARLFAHITFHRFFDEAIRNSVEQFHGGGQPAINK